MVHMLMILTAMMTACQIYRILKGVSILFHQIQTRTELVILMLNVMILLKRKKLMSMAVPRLREIRMMTVSLTQKMYSLRIQMNGLILTMTHLAIMEMHSQMILMSGQTQMEIA